MTMYKLIAVDMDGTLLNDDKKISKANLEAIKKIRRMGKKAVLSTGRPLVGIRRFIEELDMISDEDFVIAFNGALVQRIKSGKVISKTTLALEDYKDLYQLSLKLGVNIHALTESTVMAPKNSQYTDVESQINDIPIEIIPVDEVDEQTTIVKVMFIDDPQLLDQIVSKIPQEIKERYTILRSAPYFLEFLHKTVNKGTGVEAVAKELGLESKEVICVGDAGNDLAMIEYAGLGVAMGNAFDEVKEIADYITLSNNNNGVAHVIEKYMLD